MHKALIFLCLIFAFVNVAVGVTADCNKLRMGQYLCPDPKLNQIDPKTQQYRGCTRENKAKVFCTAIEEINCTETGNNSFTKELPCKWT